MPVDAASGGPCKSGQDSQQRRFSRTPWSEKSADRVGFDGEIERRNHSNLITIRLLKHFLNLTRIDDGLPHL